jgi:2-polyprenyl-6-methoxyphenol hydroxylase-like FAD-dependent oxidoreductase
MSRHAVVIAGGGPTGMMLAAELALAKVDVAVVERRPDHVLVGSRAGGFHSRTIEVLDQRGIADRFLAEGQVAQASMIGTTVLDMSDFPTRHPYSLGIWQNEIERVMAAWIAELPVRMYYGDEVTGFAQDGTGVDVEIAEVEVSEDPELGMRRDAVGVHAIGRLEYEIRDGEVVYMDRGPVRVMVTEQQLGPAGEPTLRDLSDALVTVYGTDFGIHDPTSISRFTDMTRQAAAYRAGRVMLAGDAAHVHYPAGGQGLSLGVQDAVNLGWKLAQVVHGTSKEGLLDTYHDERHPVAARALRGQRSHCRVDPSRRICRVGGRGHRDRIARGADRVVWSARCDVAPASKRNATRAPPHNNTGAGGGPQPPPARASRAGLPAIVVWDGAELGDFTRQPRSQPSPRPADRCPCAGFGVGVSAADKRRGPRRTALRARSRRR